MTSQKELAARLNLSPATISKAFRDAHDIPAETKARIRLAAEECGLSIEDTQKKSRAQKEKAKDADQPPKVRLIGVLYANAIQVNRHQYMIYIDGLGDEANANNASLIIHQTSGDGADMLDENRWPAALRGGLVDGLVLIYHFRPDVVAALAARFPVVTITRWAPDARCDHVDSDHLRGMHLLIAHLAELGHRRIGFVAPSAVDAFAQSRYASMVRAMLAHGLGTPARAWMGDAESPGDFRAAARVIAEGRHDGVTAWVCDADTTADHILLHLDAEGVRVPEDVSLTGFDGFSRHLTRPLHLTTIRIPTHTMGAKAIQTLLARIERPNDPIAQTLLDVEFVLGDTTGPAPA